MVKVSVIIPTHNRDALIGDTIKSLKNQHLRLDEFEIIVVDNASTDNTKGVVEQCNCTGGKEIFYLYEENLGLHNARHAGAKVAKGGILAFTDDDAIYDSHWLSKLLRFYSDPGVGCVGGRILPKWEVSPPEWIQHVPKGFFSLLDLGDEPKELHTPGIYGVNFSIRKDLLFKLGGFNPESFGHLWLGDGETGLLKKVLKAGYKIIYAPDALCWHFIPKERITIEYIKRRAANEGAAASYSVWRGKRFSKLTLIVRVMALAIYSFCHYTLSKVKKNVCSNKWYYHEWRKAYGFSRLSYEWRLIYDHSLKELVLKDDWIYPLSPSISSEESRPIG